MARLSRRALNSIGDIVSFLHRMKFLSTILNWSAATLSQWTINLASRWTKATSRYGDPFNLGLSIERIRYPLVIGPDFVSRVFEGPPFHLDENAQIAGEYSPVIPLLLGSLLLESFFRSLIVFIRDFIEWIPSSFTVFPQVPSLQTTTKIRQGRTRPIALFARSFNSSS